MDKDFVKEMHAVVETASESIVMKTEEDVLAALDAAAPGPFAMGSVGGGTGMITYEFKAGVGSASRQVTVAGADYTLGVYVQANFGLRPELVVAGVPVGRHIRGDEMRGGRDQGSIIAVVATDAPLRWRRGLRGHNYSKCP